MVGFAVSWESSRFDSSSVARCRCPGVLGGDCRSVLLCESLSFAASSPMRMILSQTSAEFQPEFWRCLSFEFSTSVRSKFFWSKSSLAAEDGAGEFLEFIAFEEAITWPELHFAAIAFERGDCALLGKSCSMDKGFATDCRG